jgi:hypothetical protein
MHQIRRLTSEEEVYFRKSELGKKARNLGPLSKIGPSSHLYIGYCDVDIRLRKIHLGDGEYIWDGPNLPVAKKGKEFKLEYSYDIAYSNTFNTARDFGIEIIEEPHYPVHEHLIYFESRYENVILKSLKYVDDVYSEWSRKRSFFSNFFGSIYMEYDSAQAVHMRATIKDLFKSIR